MTVVSARFPFISLGIIQLLRGGMAGLSKFQIGAETCRSKLAHRPRPLPAVRCDITKDKAKTQRLSAKPVIRGQTPDVSENPKPFTRR